MTPAQTAPATPASPAPETLSLSGFAAHIGKSASYVTKLKHQGRLVLNLEGRVLVQYSLQRIAETADPSRPGKALNLAQSGQEGASGRGFGPGTDPGEAPEERDYQASRAKREHYAAEKAEMEYRQAAGQLLETAQVISVMTDAAAQIRNRLESLPDTLAPILAATPDPDQVRATLAEHIAHALTTLSQDFGRWQRAGEGA